MVSFDLTDSSKLVTLLVIILTALIFVQCGTRLSYPTPPTENSTATSTYAIVTSPPATIQPTPTSVVTPPPFLQNTKGPFLFPTWGYLGLAYREPCTKNGDRLHPGIDIWTYQYGQKKATNKEGQGNPVFVVYDGMLGRSSSGFINVCHDIDKGEWPGLPNYHVCTYYAHLVDVPEKFSKLKKGSCPEDLVYVKQGEFIGYAAYANPAIHLHFSVKAQSQQYPDCWEAEPQNGVLDDERWQFMNDPFVYFGLNPTDYSWMMLFP